jgi:hypothetical protein
MYTQEDIMLVFKKPALRAGLEKYQKIMDSLYTTDVSKDREFQKLYNHFYRMRQRKPEFYQLYYTYMEKMKGCADPISFEDILRFIHNETGRYEASFSSKLLATLNPSKPVWDTFVLENLGVKKISSTAKDREQKVIAAYDQICSWYDTFSKSEDADLILTLFDQTFPAADITTTKKIDLFLWQNR